MFLILSFPRCGTHMLRLALAENPCVESLGEVFNPHHPYGKHGLKSVREIVAQLASRKSRDVVGFAAHYHSNDQPIATAPAEAWPNLWANLPAALQSDTTVLLLRRQNLLRRHVSHLVALQTRQWTWTAPYPKVKPRPIRVDLELLKADFRWFQKSYSEVERLFPNHVGIDYENLVQYWPREISRIQQAIGVTPIALKPLSRKQGGHLREMVLNYEDLKSEFRGESEYEFFDE